MFTILPFTKYWLFTHMLNIQQIRCATQNVIMRQLATESKAEFLKILGVSYSIGDFHAAKMVCLFNLFTNMNYHNFSANCRQKVRTTQRLAHGIELFASMDYDKVLQIIGKLYVPLIHGSWISPLHQQGLPQCCCKLSINCAFHPSHGSWSSPLHQQGLPQSCCKLSVNCAFHSKHGSWISPLHQQRLPQFCCKLKSFPSAESRIHPVRRVCPRDKTHAFRAKLAHGFDLLTKMVFVNRVNTRQFFAKLSTKMSTVGANPLWRQFLVLVNHGQHKAILY